MSFKRKVLFLCFILLLAAFILGCLLAVAYFLIPSYTEQRFFPEIAKQLGVSHISGKIRRIHFNGTDLGPIIIGDPRKPALEVESVRIVYSPKNLYRGRVKRIVISGVKLYARYQNGAITLRGINLEKVADRLRSRGKPAPDTGKFPGAIGFESLELRNAVVMLTWREQTVRLPLEIRVTPENATLKVLNVSVSGYFRGGKVTAAGMVDLNAGTVKIDYQGLDLALDRYSDIIHPIPGLRLSGRVDVSGQATLTIQPFKLLSFSAEAQYRQARIDHEAFSLANVRSPRGDELPIRLEIRRNGGGVWTLTLSRVLMVSPLPVRIDTLDGRFKIGPDTVECAGDISFSIEPNRIKHPLPVQWNQAVLSRGRFNASWAAPGRWEFMLDTLPQEDRQGAGHPVHFSVQGVQVASKFPEWTASGSGTRENGEFTFRLKVPGSRVTSPNTAFSMGAVSLKSNARLDLLTDSPKITADFTLSVPRVKWQRNSAKVNIPDISITGKLGLGNGGKWRMNALVKFTNAAFSDSNLGMRIDGIRGRIPLHWPPVGKGRKGMVSVSGINRQGRSLGSVATVIQQKGRTLNFTGNHVSSVFPDLKVHFSGKAELPSDGGVEATLDFEIPGYRPAEDLDLGSFFPAAGGFRAGGRLALSGHLAWRPEGPTCAVNTTLTDATLSFEEKRFAVEGIAVSLSIPDLFQIRSAPGQQLRFQTARLGDLNMEAGQVAFQIESAGSLFIEKSSFKWCGGHVDTHAMRISPDSDDYRLVLYCDRLLLSKVLEQFGAVQAEGSGTLNGKIPVRFHNGKITFDDGFLYSTPGQSGTIRLRGTEILTAGIPGNTREYAQLELAREALKDYTYTWVKLRLNTEGETLLLRMQMDGKPAKPLPFIYDKKIGGFVRVDAGRQGSIFQGISLDVNFRLPLDKILFYQDIFNNIE